MNRDVRHSPAGVQAALPDALGLASRRWRARLNERLKPLGLTDARLQALRELAASPAGLRQNELAVRLGIEEPTTVRMVDALEAAGWAERGPDPGDRRARRVRLTPQAQAVLEQGGLVARRLGDQVLEQLGNEAAAACLESLELMARVLATR